MSGGAPRAQGRARRGEVRREARRGRPAAAQVEPLDAADALGRLAQPCAAAAAKRSTGTGYCTVTPWIGGPAGGSGPSW